jgi:hypothetical protein
MKLFTLSNIKCRSFFCKWPFSVTVYGVVSHTLVPSVICYAALSEF